MRSASRRCAAGRSGDDYGSSTFRHFVTPGVAADDEIVATEYAGKGWSARYYFRAAVLMSLRLLKGDTGGRHLLSDDRFNVTKIVFEPAAVDVDTPTDLEKPLGARPTG